MTLFGLDISHYQNGLSLKKAHAEGFRFVFIRTSDGTYVDKAFRSHLEDAKQTPLIKAAYFYLRHPYEGTTIQQQVNVVIKQLGKDRLPVWVDAETTAIPLAHGHIREAKRLLAEAGIFCPGVYTGKWYWEGVMDNPSWRSLGALWLSNYGTNRKGAAKAIYPGDNAKVWTSAVGGKTPDILQFGSRGEVAGFLVDVNAYRGSAKELHGLLGYPDAYGVKPKRLPNRKPSIIRTPDPVIPPLVVDPVPHFPSVPKLSFADIAKSLQGLLCHLIGLVRGVLKRRGRK